jgi:intraflagellar transport protein 88
MTGQAGGGGGDARPMTSVSGAGFSSAGAEQKSFDPLNMNVRGPAPALAEKSDNSPEDRAKEMEKKVHVLLEASADAIVAKNYLKALEKAKDTGKAERALCKFKESNGLVDQINIDLTYAIFFNLANAYYHNKMYEEALNTYKLIVKNKQYVQSGRLRINMGNIYYDQQMYQQAIKMYRMALDKIPATGKDLRYRVFRNIGNSFVKLGQFQDAIESYESVMTGNPDIQTAFNLLLCLYARGDKEKIKKQFLKLLTVPIAGMTDEDEEKENDMSEEKNEDFDEALLHPERNDTLKELLHARHEQANEYILTAARLIAPTIEEGSDSGPAGDFVAGYKWVMEQLRSDFEIVSSKLEVDLAMEYMKRRKFDNAIDVLKGFEKKEASLKAMAGTNLSFIYFLEGDYAQAEKNADWALKSDRYNAKALVNKGNCFFMHGETHKAKELYLEAIGVEADCVEAIYNLGQVNLKMDLVAEAHQAFDKLYTILPNVPEALFQLGAIYDKGTTEAELEQAAKTYEMLLNKVPGDPNVCSRLGLVYEKLEDDNTACHWHTEAHRCYPVNLNVISWLGVWYVKREMYEQAIEFFEQASAVQPSEVKWRLMVTSCYRRLGDYFRALELYQQIHEEHPTNVESLQYLEALCKDLGRPHEEYSAKLEKLRRSQPMPQATQQGAAATRVEQQQTQQQQTQGGNMRSERPSRPDRNNDESNQPAARYVLLRISLLSYICAITVSAILLTNRVCQCL